MDDPVITGHLAAGSLDRITGHGELDEPDGCFLRIEPVGSIHTYGLASRRSPSPETRSTSAPARSTSGNWRFLTASVREHPVMSALPTGSAGPRRISMSGAAPTVRARRMRSRRSYPG